MGNNKVVGVLLLIIAFLELVALPFFIAPPAVFLLVYYVLLLAGLMALRRRPGLSTRKGQITVFMILGIVMIAVTGFLIQAQSKISQIQLEKQNEKLVSDMMQTNALNYYVTLCLDKSVKTAIERFGMQGGYVYKYQDGTFFLAGDPDPYGWKDVPVYSNFTYEGRSYNVSYLITRSRDYSEVLPPDVYPCRTSLGYGHEPLWCGWVNDPMLNPDLDLYSYGQFNLKGLCQTSATRTATFCPYTGDPPRIDATLGSYITQLVKDCVEFESIPGINETYTITEGEDAFAEVSFGRNIVGVNLEFPIIITIQGRPPVTKLLYFYNSQPVRFLEAYTLAYRMLIPEVNDLEYDMVADTKARNIVPNYMYLTKHERGYDDIIIIKDERSLIEGRPFIFAFARQNRYPILDAIDYQANNMYEIIAYENESSISISPRGWDPDEDELFYTYTGWRAYDWMHSEMFDSGEGCDPYGDGDTAGMCANLSISGSDLGPHNVTVTVTDGNLSDWQTVRILIDDIIVAVARGYNQYLDVRNDWASLEDFYVLDAANTRDDFSSSGQLMFRWVDEQVHDLLGNPYDLSNPMYDGPSPFLRIPADLDVDGYFSIWNVSAPYSEPVGMHNVLLTAYGTGTSGADLLQVDVKQCLPHYDPWAAAWPYSNATRPFTNDDEIDVDLDGVPDRFYNKTVLDPFLANHTCCAPDGTYQAPATPCYQFVSFTCGAPLASDTLSEALPPANYIMADQDMDWTGFQPWVYDMYVIHGALDGAGFPLPNFPLPRNRRFILNADPSGFTNEDHDNDYYVRTYTQYCGVVTPDRDPADREAVDPYPTGSVPTQGAFQPRGNICNGTVFDVYEQYDINPSTPQIESCDFPLAANQGERCGGCSVGYGESVTDPTQATCRVFSGDTWEHWNYVNSPLPADFKDTYFRDRSGNLPDGACIDIPRCSSYPAGASTYDDVALNGLAASLSNSVCRATCNGADGSCTAVSARVCEVCNDYGMPAGGPTSGNQVPNEYFFCDEENGYIREFRCQAATSTCEPADTMGVPNTLEFQGCEDPDQTGSSWCNQGDGLVTDPLALTSQACGATECCIESGVDFDRCEDPCEVPDHINTYCSGGVQCDPALGGPSCTFRGLGDCPVISDDPAQVGTPGNSVFSGFCSDVLPDGNSDWCIPDRDIGNTCSTDFECNDYDGDGYTGDYGCYQDWLDPLGMDMRCCSGPYVYGGSCDETPPPQATIQSSGNPDTFTCGTRDTALWFNFDDGFQFSLGVYGGDFSEVEGYFLLYQRRENMVQYPIACMPNPIGVTPPFSCSWAYPRVPATLVGDRTVVADPPISASVPNPSNGLTDGYYRAIAQAYDGVRRAGPMSDDTCYFNIDTTPPSVANVYMYDGELTGTSNPRPIQTNSLGPGNTFIGRKPISDMLHMRVSMNDNAPIRRIGTGVYIPSFNPAYVLPEFRAYSECRFRYGPQGTLSPGNPPWSPWYGPTDAANYGPYYESEVYANPNPNQYPSDHIGCTGADMYRRFCVTDVPLASPSGIYEMEVQCRDQTSQNPANADPNVGSFVLPVYFRIDRDPPTVDLFELTEGTLSTNPLIHLHVQASDTPRTSPYWDDNGIAAINYTVTDTFTGAVLIDAGYEISPVANDIDEVIALDTGLAGDASLSVCVDVMDYAGNMGGAPVCTPIFIDMGNPTVTLTVTGEYPASGPQYSNELFRIAWSGTDFGSGIAYCSLMYNMGGGPTEFDRDPAAGSQALFTQTVSGAVDFIPSDPSVSRQYIFSIYCEDHEGHFAGTSSTGFWDIDEPTVELPRDTDNDGDIECEVNYINYIFNPFVTTRYQFSFLADDPGLYQSGLAEVLSCESAISVDCIPSVPGLQRTVSSGGFSADRRVCYLARDNVGNEAPAVCKDVRLTGVLTLESDCAATPDPNDCPCSTCTNPSSTC